jgi:RNA polymerase sigma-70 factor (ECF subfamily)
MPDLVEIADALDGSEPRDRALPILVEAFGPRLHTLGLRFCGNAEEAQDLVQEVFLLAYRKWDAFEGRAKASTWLYTIAARACQRMHRKRSGEPEHIQSLDDLLPFGAPRIAVVPDPGEGPEAAEIRAEARREVERAIASLPTIFRLPLVLKEIAGFSLAEIAQILDVKEATVKTRVHRARLGVRRALAGALPERDVPQAVYSRQVCLDLLSAKQEALDRGVEFAFPDGVVCERCAELFATLDLAQEVCRGLGEGEGLPEELRRVILEGARG